MACIWHVLHSFSAKVRESWQVEILHLIKDAINHHIGKIYWSVMHQQVCVNEVLVCKRRLRMLLWLQNPSEKQMDHFPEDP